MNDTCARWVTRAGVGVLVADLVFSALGRRDPELWRSSAQIAGGIVGGVMTLYGAAVCARLRREQRRREREEFERLLSRGAGRY